MPTNFWASGQLTYYHLQHICLLKSLPLNDYYLFIRFTQTKKMAKTTFGVIAIILGEISFFELKNSH